MRIILAPNPTGTGHNMRMYAISQELKKYQPDMEIIVYLSSMQDIFAKLFKSIDVQVYDLAPDQVVDHSSKSHLKETLNWSTMVSNYIVPTFFNGSTILKYMSNFKEHNPDLILSDFNTNASIAASLLNIPNVFVTERFNFTLRDVGNELLTEGGFTIASKELDTARVALNELFDWMCSNTNLILTDKPYVEKLDKARLIEKYFKSGKAKFVGPMIRPIPSEKEKLNIKEKLNLGEGPIIVATVSGTTMFAENKKKLLETFIRMFTNIKNKYPKAQMVLLGREHLEDLPEGIISQKYLPNWMPLLQQADLLLAHPGWITVTEVSALKIPSIFCLSSYKEYHEVEAFERLKYLQYCTHLGHDENELTKKVDLLLSNPESMENLLENYKKIAPDSYGSSRAAQEIMKVIQLDNKILI